MTPVPLPDTPCVRVRMIYSDVVDNDLGNRFYLAYTGTAPSGATCATLASDIAAAYETNLVDLAGSDVTLDEVDVLDIATDSGLSGQWTGAHEGTNGTANLPVQCCTNVELGIARRYRGGKPRLYFPFGCAGNQSNAASWNGEYITAVNTQVAAFFAEIEALTPGTITSLQHVNLSYYSGFHNVTNSSGRERAVPTYRDTAKSDVITGYSCKATIGSQRRRRTSSTA